MLEVENAVVGQLPWHAVARSIVVILFGVLTLVLNNEEESTGNTHQI